MINPPPVNCKPLGFGNWGLVSVFLLACSLLALRIWPELDLEASAWFYSPNRGFMITHAEWAKNLRWLGQWSARAIALVLLIALCASLILKQYRVWWSRLFIALSGFIISATVLVEVVFKPVFGRARPNTTTEFGGQLPFTPAWTTSDNCLAQCSFPSGEAAGAAAFLALAWLVPNRYWKFALIPVMLWIIIISILRVSFGRHFLSDVITSWVITYLTIWVVSRLVLRRQNVQNVPQRAS